MSWSISGYKQFQRCRHQWCLKNKVADERVKHDSFRKEITLLSRLQTVQAWRGTIVDDVISRLAVNAINSNMPLSKDYLVREAFKAFDQQFEYAVFQRYREANSSYSDSNFAALLPFEFGYQNIEGELKQAKEDIDLALTNFLNSKKLIDYLRSAKKVISQRPLMYDMPPFTVQAKPDLIALFTDKPPHIFDWKVHTYGIHTYDQQLVSYAIALFKVNKLKPHADFPKELAQFKLQDYKLTEYQLLHKDRIRRDYTITDDRLEEFDEELSSSMMEMYRAGAHKSYQEWGPEHYPITDYMENCHNCGFKKICQQ